MWKGWFGGANQYTLLVDPDAGGDVDDSQELIKQMRLINECRVSRLGRFNPGAGSEGTRGVEGDGDHLQAERVEFAPECLPHGQVKATASPGGPGQEQHLLTTQGLQREGVPIEIRQHQIGRLSAGEGMTPRFGTKTPHLMRRIMQQWHPEPLGQNPHIGAPRRRRWQRDAAISLAGSFWFDLPSGPTFQCCGVYLESREYHAAAPPLLGRSPRER
jgi:hypothetical protein